MEPAVEVAGRGNGPQMSAVAPSRDILAEGAQGCCKGAIRTGGNAVALLKSVLQQVPASGEKSAA